MGVGGLIALMILIAIGALVLYEVTDVVSEDAEDDRVTTAVNSLNATFAENTIGIPDNWDNYAENSAVNILQRSASGEFVETYETLMDNDNVMDNGYWVSDALNVPSLQDGVHSASLAYSIRRWDNDNASTLISEVLLERPGGDNVTIWSENAITRSSTWTARENDITAHINALGDYKIWLVSRMHGWGGAELGPGLGEGENMAIQFDSVTLTITTFSKGYAENVIDEVEERGDTVFNLLTILAIVIVAALIIGVVMRAIGGIGGVRRSAGTPMF